ncbi:SAM-dependent methyltransferase [Streptomyces sp. NPDC017520]|uniref:SAM-dependent methyltransferase n=1 Tax=Streptomyces sp. NPDC017520 TaxID=3364998 RepID=UPI00379C4A5F
MSQASRTPEERYRLGMNLVEQLGSGEAVPTTFELLDMEWEVLPGTYAPHRGTGTEWYTTVIPYPKGGRFLEIGSGAGVTAIWAAVHGGCSHVTATDITEAAVGSTTRNAELHGVADRITTLRSDVFADLDAEDRFDVVFWNCSVFEAPSEFEFTRDVEWAIFDRGYEALGRYLSQAHDRLLPGGRALVTFNTLGDAARVTAVAADAGVTLKLLDSSARSLKGHDVTYKLFEILPGKEG